MSIEFELGARCPHDGGKCHHYCENKCFRKDVHASLSVPWQGFPVPGDKPVRRADTLNVSKPHVRLRARIPEVGNQVVWAAEVANGYETAWHSDSRMTLAQVRSYLKHYNEQLIAVRL